MKWLTNSLLITMASLFLLCGHGTRTQSDPDMKQPEIKMPLPHYAIALTAASQHPDSSVSPELRHRRFRRLPGYRESDAVAVNHHHLIVGSCAKTVVGAMTILIETACVWQEGRVRALGMLPDYLITHAVAINDAGLIVGNGLSNSAPPATDAASHAVCWIHAKAHDLGAGEALSVNEAGDIVGDSGTGSEYHTHDQHALLWTHSYRYDLNDCIPAHSGWVLTSATGINDKDQIVGHGLFHGKDHAFLLTPR